MRNLPRILIVEDEPAIAELIAVNLRHNGFQPIWAMDGITAQKELDDVLPDAILLDWMLPGDSGLSLSKRWRGHARTKDIPIIMLTARNEEIDRVLKLFKYDERWQQIKVSEVFEPNLSPIEGSSQTLQQLLTILLNFGMESLAGKTTAKLHIETYFIDDRPAFKMSSTAWFSEEALRLITSEQLQWSGISETEFDLVVSRYLAESVGYSLDIITDGEQQTLQLSSMPSDKKAMRSPE